MAKGLRIVLLAAVLLIGTAVYYWLRTSPVQQAGGPQPGASATASASGTADRPKPPLDIPRAVSLPGAWQQQTVYVKPGHWASLWFEATAERENFDGTLAVELQPESQVRESIASWGRLETRRPVTLAKREPRIVEQWLYVPNSYDHSRQTFTQRHRGVPPHVMSTLNPFGESLLRGAQVRVALQTGMFPAYETRLPVTTLRHHQSLLVVLSSQPDAYRFWAQLPVVTAPSEPDALAPEQHAHYRLILADDKLKAPLPSSLEGWTTTGAIVWDRYDPARLSDEQRQALLDWLHWGGRLIVSGPESLEMLGNSFLAKYLPAEAGGTVELSDAALESLDALTIEGPDAQRPTPWRGVELQPVAGSDMVLAGEVDQTPLVVERSVGRGHVLLTAFRLTEPSLVDWPSYDALVHNTLLARQSRVWRHPTGRPDTAVAAWRDRTDWFNPWRTSGLAFVARDAKVTDLSQAVAPTAAGIFGGERSPVIGPGTAAWRDDDGLTLAARAVLDEDTGLVIPSVRFVLGMIAAYVVLLVPVNWFVFSRFGRPELAWLAAPVVAVGFSVYVIRSANLDIGFARTLTEIAVIETQPDYARAHVTRWGSLYNSLSHDYDIATDDPTLVAVPVGEVGEGPSSRNADKVYVRDDAAQAAGRRTPLAGWNVASNTSGRYRTEQLLDAGGSVQVERLADDKCRLTNGTRWTLADVRIDGEFTAHVETLSPGQSTVLSQDPPSPAVNASRLPPRDKLRHTATTATGDKLHLSAWIDDAGLATVLEPEPKQSRRLTLLVAHLEYAEVVRQRDANLPTNPLPP